MGTGVLRGEAEESGDAAVVVRHPVRGRRAVMAPAPSAGGPRARPR
ncbi:hypothetical protein STXM2123_3328 [Streptomyces sp. F-3]|nr:hypothetical protein STXM2123_3328 [Streptomyces sp. F-3]